jgi:hypothetical protein
LKEYVNVVVSVNDPNDWRTVADGGKPAREAITSLQQAIAELESQEPVAWLRTSGIGSPVVTNEMFNAYPEMRWSFETPLYTHPPQRTEPKVCCQQYDTCLEPCTPRGEHLAQRTWVGLTGEMLLKAAQSSLAPEQYDHFEAMSKHQPDIYDRLAYAIRVQDE